MTLNLDIESLLRECPPSNNSVTDESQLFVSDLRSLKLHTELSKNITPENWNLIKQKLISNINKDKTGISGLIHSRNVNYWETIINNNDIKTIKKHMSGIQDIDIQLRQVSPFRGVKRILTEDTVLQ